jgi:hypothetical protein
MTITPMVSLWARTGLIYFFATMAFGLYLGITGQFHASSPHAHLGLLGWLSSMGFALLHALGDPRGELRGMARVHWILHNVGVLVHAVSLWLTIQGRELGMFIGIGGIIVIIATLLFAAMIWRRLSPVVGPPQT